MDIIKMWTRLPMEESVRMTEDRDNWRKYDHGVANARIERWRSKALVGPGSTVTLGPSVASAQELKLEARSAESGGGALRRACYRASGAM